MHENDVDSGRQTSVWGNFWKNSPTSAPLSNELLAHLFAWIIDCNDFMASNGTGHMDRSVLAKLGKHPSGNIVYIRKWESFVFVENLTARKVNMCTICIKYAYRASWMCTQMGNDAKATSPNDASENNELEEVPQFAVKCSSIIGFIAHAFVHTS